MNFDINSSWFAVCVGLLVGDIILYFRNKKERQILQRDAKYWKKEFEEMALINTDLELELKTVYAQNLLLQNELSKGWKNNEQS